ncbi:MAG: nuclear transport factor 2 family protein [Rhizobium sp.]
MTDFNTLAERYVAVWNETDAARRKALIAETFAEDSFYVDPLMQAVGRDQLAALVAGVHGQFPGFRFRLDGKADGHGQRIRFSWTLGPEGVEAPVRGTDFAEIEDGRFVRIVGFLDKVPAAA